MGSYTTSVKEANIRLDNRAFFAFAAGATGKHTGWLREIGKEFLAKGTNARFSFRYFVGSKLVGYEDNPELQVVLKAIEAHLIRTKQRAFGRVTLRGEVDDLPRHILLDYFNGTLSFTYPVWHALDLRKVALPESENRAETKTPAPEGGELEPGVAYILRRLKDREVEWIAVGAVGTRLKTVVPNGKVKVTKLPSRAETLAGLARFIEGKRKAGFAVFERQPMWEIFDSKTCGWARR